MRQPVRGPWQFITCEYPPAIGGVSDFSKSLACALARRGEQVDVWTAGAASPPSRDDGGIRVRSIRRFDAAGLRMLSTGLGAASDGHLFIHWVPHGYGARGMNLGFCRWVRGRAAAGDRVTMMVHEPFLPLPPARLRHLPIALVQRRMMKLLLASASRVCVSTTAWLPGLERSGLRSSHAVLDLPIASSIVPVEAPGEAAGLTARLKGNGTTLIGHFGSFGASPSRLLSEVARRLIARSAGARLVLIGRNSGEAATALARECRLPPDTIVGSGTVSARQLSLFIQACDLFVQPYIDGATTRRSTLATLLAHGVPVVTTTGPLTEAEWHADPRPVIAAPVDPDAIAGAAAALLDSADARRDLAHAARAIYAARFDIDRTAERLLAA